jgi:hypothetical protein
MKVLLSPFLVVTLALQAAGSLGGAVLCPMLGERRADCCCPDKDNATPDAVLHASCCDVLSGVAPASVAQERGPGMEKVPARSSLAQDVALPSQSLAAATPGPDFLVAVRGSGPPGPAPVYLSLRQLLL